MTDPIDFGPSEMRLLEIGALQERVRVLEAGMNDTLHPEDLDAAAAEFYLATGFERMKVPLGRAIIAYRRHQRARVLSEMAAADAEMLEPKP